MIAEPGPYAGTILAWLLMALLMLIQVLVADIAGLRARHEPGTPVTHGHDVFLFRATRALANTNESIAIFVLLTLAAAHIGVSPVWTNGLALAFVAARAGHALCYWLDLRAPRSVAFGLGLAALLVLAGFTIRSLF